LEAWQLANASFVHAISVPEPSQNSMHGLILSRLPSTLARALQVWLITEVKTRLCTLGRTYPLASACLLYAFPMKSSDGPK